MRSSTCRKLPKVWDRLWNSSTNAYATWNGAFPPWKDTSENQLPTHMQRPGAAPQEPLPPARFGGSPPVKTPTGAATVLGKAVLGIAGAYLLRALAESGAIPKLPVLIAAIVYASLWIVWAVRTHATSRLASVTYGVTSALILAPLLWESTVRFQVLPPIFAAVELVAFAVLALALAWPRNLQVIPSVATLVTIITALADDRNS